MARFQANQPSGIAVQELEVLVRAAVFKSANAIVGWLLQQAADRIDEAFQPRCGQQYKGRVSIQIDGMFGRFLLDPRSKKKAVTRIEILTPYNNLQIGQERWFIEHEGQDTAAYLVRLIPDGHGGTTFTVQRDSKDKTKGTP